MTKPPAPLGGKAGARHEEARGPRRAPVRRSWQRLDAHGRVCAPARRSLLRLLLLLLLFLLESFFLSLFSFSAGSPACSPPPAAESVRARFRLWPLPLSSLSPSSPLSPLPSLSLSSASLPSPPDASGLTGRAAVLLAASFQDKSPAAGTGLACLKARPACRMPANLPANFPGTWRPPLDLCRYRQSQ